MLAAPMAKTTGELIRQAREAADVTQVQAAKAVGITQGFWSNLENGERQPSVKTLKKIAAALGCSVTDLISDE